MRSALLCSFFIFCFSIIPVGAEELWHRKAIAPPLSFLNKEKDTHANHFKGQEIDNEITAYFQNQTDLDKFSKISQQIALQKSGNFSFLNKKRNKFKRHWVKKGESLWSISKKYKISRKALLRSNPKVKTRSTIYIGERLYIPTMALYRGRRKKTQYHKIKKGETLYSIAKKYSVTISHIERLNRVSNKNKIEIGQYLKIRAGKAAVPRGYRKEKVFVPPLKGKVTSRFGRRRNPFLRSRVSYHKGIDIAAKLGTPFHASNNGVVIRSRRMGSYGNCIFILHPNDYISVYAHNKKNLVQKGSIVDKGRRIGLVGRTGSATGPHLHFEVRKLQVPMDPFHAFQMTQIIKKNKQSKPFRLQSLSQNGL